MERLSQLVITQMPNEECQTDSVDPNTTLSFKTQVWVMVTEILVTQF